LILLDTCVLVDYHRFQIDPEEEYEASAISRAELEFGINMESDPVEKMKRAQRLATLDTRFRWIPFDVNCSRAYGYIASHAKPNTGAKVRNKDALIAAQAYAIGASVMTDNLDDFARFSHLIPVVSPTWQGAN